MEEGSIASQNDIEGKLQFITDDPGRQMIGSFHPLTDDDWYIIPWLFPARIEVDR